MRWFRRKPEPESPGATLSRMGVEKRRKLIHDTADEMRARMGMSKVDWSNL